METSQSYLDTLDNQLSQGASPTVANDNATEAIKSSSYISSTIANPDGNPVNAEVKPEVNQVVPTPTPTVTPNVIETPKTKEAASSAVEDINLGVANNAAQEAQSQIELTKKLGEIDVTQANTKVSNAQENFNEAQKIQTDQMIQKNANELEYQAKLQEETAANVAAAKMQQEAENALNAATAAEMKIKQENAEKEAEIANDVAKQSSAIAFAKLGLSFSGAAINTSQQIYAQGARNIAELRSSNAKNYADLRVKIDRVAFDHQTVINGIISDANEKQFASKERLREFIGNAQTNILLSKKEAQKEIQDALTTYKGEAQGREDKLYSDMTSANAKLLEATKAIQTSVNATQEASKTKIDLLTKNGQWAGLSEVQKAEYERAAGLPVGTTDRTTNLLSTQGINERLKELTGVTIALPVATLQNMQNDIKKYMASGYPMGTAIQMTVDRYKNNIPEVKAAIEAKDKKTNLANAKTQAEIDKLNSEATQNLSEIDIAKAKLVIAQKTGSGSSEKLTTASFTDNEGMPLVIKDGIPHRLKSDGTAGDVYGAKKGETILNKKTPQAPSEWSLFAQGKKTLTNSDGTDVVTQ